MQFKENNQPRFKHREERRSDERSPRFSDKGKMRGNEGKSDRPHKLHFKRDEAYSRSEQIYPAEGKKASGEGSVQIWVKGGNSSVKEKKNGPLSPRAPEKIKKNRLEEMKVYGEMPVSVCSNNVLDLLYVYGQQWRGQKN